MVKSLDGLIKCRDHLSRKVNKFIEKLGIVLLKMSSDNIENISLIVV